MSWSGCSGGIVPNSIAKTCCTKQQRRVEMANDKKRVAWVTGGGSGIGQAGAEALAADNWTVIVSGRRKDALDAVVAGINANGGGKAEALVLDVSHAADVDAAAQQILARH